MKKAWPILIILLLLVGAYCLQPNNEPNMKGVSYSLTGEEKRLLHTGDIMMRRGDGLVSDGIAKILQEPFDVTHCGVVLEENGKLWIIHAMQDKERGVDGVFAQGLEQFVAESRPSSVIVVRYKTSEAQIPKLVDRMHHYLKQDIPFDLGFDASDPSSFYCSELLQHLYMDTYETDIFPITLSLPTADLLKYTYLFDTTAFLPIINHQLAAKPIVVQE
jgi:hypothetical protein